MAKLDFNETTAEDSDGQTWSIEIRSGQTTIGVATLTIKPERCHLEVLIDEDVVSGELPAMTSSIGFLE